MKNEFLKAATNVAYTENGALSYATTNSVCVDQFSKAGSYRGRDIEVVFSEQSALWDANREFAVKFPFYLRMITRKVKMNDGTTISSPQRGQGARDESFKRLLWFAKFQPEIFYKNLWLLPIIGSWKDLWILMSMDNCIDQKKVFAIIAEGCQSETQKDLVKKYMPQIRSNKKCTTEWTNKMNNLAKAFCKWAGWTAQEYRMFKSTGKAHEFQKLISQGKYSEINWNNISGKALLNLSSGKFLDNHNLVEQYIDWISTTPVAKFNGYPYELGEKMKHIVYLNTGSAKASKMTIDAQFENLIKIGKENTGGITGNVWCALDTSGSMGTRVSNKSTLSAYDVCISLGIYFASMNEGSFNKNVIMFDDISKVKQLSGTFSNMYKQIASSSTAWGGTNFQSVINEIVRIRKSRPNIPLEDYPTTLLVVSDMQFNACYNNTNVDAAKAKLATVFPQNWVDKFKFIWWQVNGSRTTDVPSTLDDTTSYFFSGFDGSIINLLLGSNSEIIDETTGEKRTLTMQELLDNAMNQEILNFLKC